MRQAKFIISAVDKTKKVFLSIKERIKSIGKSFSAARIAAAGFAGFLTGRLLGALTGLTDSWKQLSAQIKLVTSSEEEAITVREQLLAISQRTRTELEANVSLYTNLARATKSLGLSQDEVLGITETVSQAMQISGASASESANALRQLGQAFASGQLRGDEFNSMMENAPRLSKALADSLGVTVGELRGMAEQGELTADKLAAAFQGQAGKIGEEFKVLPKTFSQVFTSIRNDVLAFIGKTDEAGGASQRMVNAISSAWASLRDKILSSQDDIVGALQGLVIFVTAVVAPLRIAFNLLTAALRGLVAEVFRAGAVWKEFLSAITLGDTSKRYQREAKALRETIASLQRDVLGDFVDMWHAVSRPLVDLSKQAADTIAEQKDKLDQKLKSSPEPSGYENLSNDIDKAAESFDKAADKAEKLKQTANSKPVKVTVAPIDVAAVINEIQRALDNTLLQVPIDITPYIDARKMDRLIQPAIDRAIARAADKAGSK